jgi:hypothetical protein
MDDCSGRNEQSENMEGNRRNPFARVAMEGFQQR